MRSLGLLIITGLLMIACGPSASGSAGVSSPPLEQAQVQEKTCEPPREEGWLPINGEISIPLYSGGAYTGENIVTPSSSGGMIVLSFQTSNGARKERNSFLAPKYGESISVPLPEGGGSFEIFSCGDHFFGRTPPSNVVSG